MKPSVVIVLSLVLSASLAACSEDETAACDSVDDLKASIESLTDIDVTSGNAISELESGLEGVEGNLADVKSDVESEFSSQIDAVETGFATLKSSVEAVKSDASASTLAAAASALTSFGADVQSLISDIESTC